MNRASFFRKCSGVVLVPDWIGRGDEIFAIRPKYRYQLWHIECSGGFDQFFRSLLRSRERLSGFAPLAVPSAACALAVTGTRQSQATTRTHKSRRHVRAK